MIKPEVVTPGEPVTQIGSVFGTPLVIKGWTWLPLVELQVWGIATWLAGKRRPQRSFAQRLGVGLLLMPFMVAMEWSHNFAHAAAARLVRKPMDFLRITWGTPLIVYHQIDDQNVTPEQHCIRALGGPLFNTFALLVTWLWRRNTRPDSLQRELADAIAGTNVLIVGAGLLPIPFLDGGPLLKWSLVRRGRTIAQANETVRRVNGPIGVLMGTLSAWSFRRKQGLLGSFLALLALMSVSIFTGLFKEQ